MVVNVAMNMNRLFFKYGIYYPITFLFGMNLNKYFNELSISQRFTKEKLDEIKLSKLNNILQYSKLNVPYYKQNIEKYSLKELNEIQELPLIDKKIIRENRNKFKASSLNRSVMSKTTGGSTGAPVTILKTKEALGRELAATWRGYHWANIGIGDRQARFWGVPHDKENKLKSHFIDFICNRYRCSAFAFSDKDLEKYDRYLKMLKPKYFYGYVSMLVQFAKYYKNHGISCPYELKCIITTSEVLTDSDRKLLQDVFRCKVYNEYGCGEIGTIAHECEEGNLHINDENIIVEILGSNQQPVKVGEDGEIVVTELNNLAMPLIRYRIADYGSFSPRSCKCGRELTVLREVKGRAYDFLINSTGEMFHGEFFLYIVEDIKKNGASLNGVQFVQKNKNELDIKIVPGSGFISEHKNYIENRIREKFDSKIKITFIEEPFIEREKSGKMRVVKRLFSH
jgi:phenylacetate-CoA ligase